MYATCTIRLLLCEWKSLPMFVELHTQFSSLYNFFSLLHFQSLMCKIPHFTLFLNSSNAFSPLVVKYEVSRPYKRTHRVTVVCNPVQSEFPRAERLLLARWNNGIALNSRSDHGYVSGLKVKVLPDLGSWYYASPKRRWLLPVDRAYTTAMRTSYFAHVCFSFCFFVSLLGRGFMTVWFLVQRFAPNI